jgi:hypothetical protein
MIYALYILSAAFGLFLGMLLFWEIGRWVGVRRKKKDSEGTQTSAGVIESAVFALLGLLIAFTFSGASSRFDDRRHLVIQETNAIGTAYLRLDLLPPDVQPELREKFRRYLDARIAAYRDLDDIEVAKQDVARANRISTEIWKQAVAASRESPSQVAMLLLPALNEMIDITTTRTMATQIHPPIVIHALLFGLALAGALLAGYGMSGSASRSWLHMLGFAVAVAIAVYVILDLEYPRLGLIRVNAMDQAMVDLRKSMD